MYRIEHSPEASGGFSPVDASVRFFEEIYPQPEKFQQENTKHGQDGSDTFEHLADALAMLAGKKSLGRLGEKVALSMIKEYDEAVTSFTKQEDRVCLKRAESREITFPGISPGGDLLAVKSLVWEKDLSFDLVGTKPPFVFKNLEGLFIQLNNGARAQVKELELNINDKGEAIIAVTMQNPIIGGDTVRVPLTIGADFSIRPLSKSDMQQVVKDAFDRNCSIQLDQKIIDDFFTLKSFNMQNVRFDVDLATRPAKLSNISGMSITLELGPGTFTVDIKEICLSKDHNGNTKLEFQIENPLCPLDTIRIPMTLCPDGKPQALKASQIVEIADDATDWMPVPMRSLWFKGVATALRLAEGDYKAVLLDLALEGVELKETIDSGIKAAEWALENPGVVLEAAADEAKKVAKDAVDLFENIVDPFGLFRRR
ncbi:MAG TPA: hypothetical protein V6D08_20210 [Candidatus Obscuribacterales bacterium]